MLQVRERVATPIYPVREVDTTATPHLASLTGLRFIAALLVVMHHFGPSDPLPAASDPLCTLKLMERNLVVTGFIGVDLFFVLSGFILTYSYLDAHGRLRGTCGSFWVSRVARIYPVYLLACAIDVMPYVWSHDPHSLPALTAVTTVTLTQQWLPIFATGWNPPGWSLSVEAFFYLVFPVLALPIARLKRPQLSLMLPLLWSVAISIPVMFLALHPTGAQGALWLRMLSHPLAELPTFLIGVVLGRLYATSPRRTGAVRRRIRPSSCAAIGLVGSIIVLIMTPRYFSPLYDVAPLPFFALLIYYLACGEGWLARVLSRPRMIVLGEASYTLYLFHWPIWSWITHFLRVPAPTTLRYVLVFLAYLCFTVALSIITLCIVERPARRTIRAAWASYAAR